MKKAFIVVIKNGQTYNNFPEGTIVGQCYENEDMFDSEVSNGDLLDVLFNDEIINTDFIKSEKIGDDWVILEDTDKKNEYAAEQRELKKMDFGQKVLAYFGVLTNDLTVEDYQTLLADTQVGVIKDLLRQGALESSFTVLSDYPINAIITQEIKDKIMAKITSFIAQV